MFGLGDGGVLNARMDNRRTDEVADEGVVEVLHDAVEEAQHGEDKALSLVDCVVGFGFRFCQHGLGAPAHQNEPSRTNKMKAGRHARGT